MKRIQLDVYVLNIHSSDGEHYTYLYRSRDEAIDHVYNVAESNWGDTFDEDDIDDYDKEEAAEHYYDYIDDWYAIEVETIGFTVQELQDKIAAALGLASHG